MTVQTTIAILAKNVKMLETGINDINLKPSMPATTNGDSQVIFTFPYAGRMVRTTLRQTAAMGGAATQKVQKRDVDTGTAVDWTVATTAATAGIVTSATIGPMDFKSGDTVEVLVGGGNLTAGIIELDVEIQHA